MKYEYGIFNVKSFKYDLVTAQQEETFSTIGNESLEYTVKQKMKA